LLGTVAHVTLDAAAIAGSIYLVYNAWEYSAAVNHLTTMLAADPNLTLPQSEFNAMYNLASGDYWANVGNYWFGMENPMPSYTAYTPNYLPTPPSQQQLAVNAGNQSCCCRVPSPVNPNLFHYNYTYVRGCVGSHGLCLDGTVGVPVLDATGIVDPRDAECRAAWQAAP
jgi:hypothetical protein